MYAVVMLRLDNGVMTDSVRVFDTKADAIAHTDTLGMERFEDRNGVYYVSGWPRVSMRVEIVEVSRVVWQP